MGEFGLTAVWPFSPICIGDGGMGKFSNNRYLVCPERDNQGSCQAKELIQKAIEIIMAPQNIFIINH